jgi:hypothetical protein
MFLPLLTEQKQFAPAPCGALDVKIKEKREK